MDQKNGTRIERMKRIDTDKRNSFSPLIRIHPPHPSNPCPVPCISTSSRPWRHFRDDLLHLLALLASQFGAHFLFQQRHDACPGVA